MSFDKSRKIRHLIDQVAWGIEAVLNAHTPDNEHYLVCILGNEITVSDGEHRCYVFPTSWTTDEITAAMSDPKDRERYRDTVIEGIA